MRIEEALLDGNLKTRCYKPCVRNENVDICNVSISDGNAERSNQPIIENTRSEFFATNLRWTMDMGFRFQSLPTRNFWREKRWNQVKIRWKSGKNQMKNHDRKACRRWLIRCQWLPRAVEAGDQLSWFCRNSAPAVDRAWACALHCNRLHCICQNCKIYLCNKEM